MKVMIIDDDSATVNAVGNMVDWEKFQIKDIFKAYNIQQAKKILENEKIDILICDIEMPMGSGLDLLKWVRANNISCEFIFLTCHESFEFAQQAIKFGAAGYLLKPLVVELLEAEIYKALGRLNYNKNSERELWRSLLMNPLYTDQQIIAEQIKYSRMGLSLDDEFFLVMICTNSIETGKDGSDLMEIGLNRLADDIFILAGEHEKVFSYYRNRSFHLILVFRRDKPIIEIKQRCEELIIRAEQSLQIMVDCYISNSCHLDKLNEKRKLLEQLNLDNVIFRGRIIQEGQFSLNVNTEEQLLDMVLVARLLANQNKIELLKMLKDYLEQLADRRKLNTHLLRRIQQDILQAVYVYLYEKNVLATELFSDEQAIILQQKSLSSYVDMMQYLTHLISKSFEYVNNIANKQTIVECMKKFIQRNYHKPITRIEVAESVFLTPEYAAKVFKKEEGINVKSYINMYRIGKAKSMLLNKNNRISDIALDTGFDNIPYFTTKFKEIVGVSPSEYRKWHVIS